MNLSMPFIVVILSVSFSLVSGLQCYSCVSRESESCGSNPTEADRVTCGINEFCIVERSERSDSTGRNVTIQRGCRLSSFVSKINTGENQVSLSVSSQSCSTDLCNTGNGLGPNNNFMFPGINGNNNFGFDNNNFGVWNDFKKTFNQAIGQSESVAHEIRKKMVPKDLNVPISLKMFDVVPHQFPSFSWPQPSHEGDKTFVANSFKSQSDPIAWLRALESHNHHNPLQQRFNARQNGQ